MKNVAYLVTRVEIDSINGETVEATAMLSTGIDVEDEIDNSKGFSIVRLRCEFSET